MKNKFEPCDCCDDRTSLSVCRKEAIKANWEDIKKMSLYFKKQHSSENNELDISSPEFLRQT